jgi:hypothetical protein
MPDINFEHTNITGDDARYGRSVAARMANRIRLNTPGEADGVEVEEADVGLEEEQGVEVEAVEAADPSES